MNLFKEKKHQYMVVLMFVMQLLNTYSYGKTYHLFSEKYCIPDDCKIYLNKTNDNDTCNDLDNRLAGPLCEVGAVCDDNDPCSALSIYDADCNCVPEFNFALVGTPSMSTGGSAIRMNDDIIATNDNSLLAHTADSSPNEWMQIDLGVPRDIVDVIIWNRVNCCAERLSNAYVLVSNNPFPSNTDLAAALANAEFTYQIGDASAIDVLTVNVAQPGRYVRLQKSGNNVGSNAMNILELQVMGDTLLVDPDGDGVCNDLDPCPTDPNDLDLDADGVCDAVDLCLGADDSIDTDNDGIPDGCDICENSTNIIADIFYGMDQMPVTGVGAIIDATGNTSGTLGNVAIGMPQSIEGASMHSFTAWDFSQTDGYIKVSPNATTARLGDINTTSGLTIGFWANLNYDVSQVFHRVAGLGNVFDIALVHEGLEFYFDGATHVIRTTNATNVFEGEWEHFTVTLDFSRTTENLVLYHNGVPIDTLSSPVNTAFHSTTSNLMIGARSNGSYFFPGQLDDFILFDEALCLQDVARLYAGGAYNFMDENYTYEIRSQAGGYDYAWSDYTTDEHTGLGSEAVNFDYTDVNTISHAPPAGVHPRVFFSPHDIPEIRNRMANTESGQQAMAQIHAYTTLMHLGRGAGGYSGSAPYAIDPDGNRRIDNEGFWDNGPYYNKLVACDASIFDDPAFDAKRRYLLGGILSAEAFECLMRAGTYDPDTGRNYDDRAADLAKALAFWAEGALQDSNLGPDGIGIFMFASADLALAYDINYHAMTIAQRDVVRAALARTIPDQLRYGENLSAYVTTSNWSTLNGFEIIPNFAIEGELGHKPELTKKWMRVARNFTTHGWYASGSGYEGIGKNYQMVTTFIAAAKRGYSLLGHPHMRSYATQFLPALTQPYGNAFTGYDDWGGSGLDAETGGYKFNNLDAIGLKWVFPNDPKVDFMWRNYIRQNYRLDSEGYVYQQISPSSGYMNSIVPMATFALDYDDVDFNSRAATAIPEDFFASERGLVNMRSGTDSSAMSTWFHCRQNRGGHTAGDRNDIHMSALGRMWLRKAYGNAFQHSYFHSCLMVNDLGVPLNTIAQQPGKILDYSASNEMTTATGDATYAYTWQWHWDGNSQPDHPWLGVDGWEAVTETPNDFQYQPQPGPYMDTPFYDYPHWANPTNEEQLVKKLYNPMERVIRSVATVRGEHPFILVVDDVQKDDAVHNYKWVAQLAHDLTVESTTVNLDNCNYQNDIILKEPDGTGNRRLLVRILHNEGYDGSTPNGYLDPLIYEPYVNSSQLSGAQSVDRNRLVVESNSIAPDFRVMLYPHFDGDLLPTTVWNATKDTLRVVFSNEQHFLALNPQNGGQWNKIEKLDETALVGICSDNNDCTLDDSFFANCDCIGVLQDVDNDGVCNDLDVCPDFNDNLIGMPCDDRDPCTELSFYDDNCNCTPIFNYALLGTPSMSSGYAPLATRLNDGIVDNNSLLAETGDASLHEWIEIDLGENRDIEEVIIWNRTNCCQERLSNVYVLVADTPFPTDTDLTAALANADFNYQIGDTSEEDVVKVDVAQIGRYVRLQKSGNNAPTGNNGENVINILELQVMGDTLQIDSDNDGICDDVDVCPGFDDTQIGQPCDDGDPCTELSIYNDNCECVPMFNYELLGTASMSSGSSSLAPRINDGIVDNASLIAYTGGASLHEWMQLDLGATRNIDEVVIWNRTNCCQARLNNAYVLVSNIPFPGTTDLNAALAVANFSYQLGDVSSLATVNVDIGQSGRYVRLQKSGNNVDDNSLNIQELQVIGDTLLIDSNNDGICDNGEVPACAPHLNLSNIHDSRTFPAAVSIRSDATVPANEEVSYEAGVEIELQPEFEVELNGVFQAIIQNCDTIIINNAGGDDTPQN